MEKVTSEWLWPRVLKPIEDQGPGRTLLERHRRAINRPRYRPSCDIRAQARALDRPRGGFRGHARILGKPKGLFKDPRLGP